MPVLAREDRAAAVGTDHHRIEHGAVEHGGRRGRRNAFEPEAEIAVTQVGAEVDLPAEEIQRPRPSAGERHALVGRAPDLHRRRGVAPEYARNEQLGVEAKHDAPAHLARGLARLDDAVEPIAQRPKVAVITRAAGQLVVAGAARKIVVAGAALQIIGSCGAGQLVVTAFAVDAIRACLAGQGVGAAFERGRIRRRIAIAAEYDLACLARRRQAIHEPAQDRARRLAHRRSGRIEPRHLAIDHRQRDIAGRGRVCDRFGAELVGEIGRSESQLQGKKIGAILQPLGCDCAGSCSRVVQREAGLTARGVVQPGAGRIERIEFLQRVAHRLAAFGWLGGSGNDVRAAPSGQAYDLEVGSGSTSSNLLVDRLDTGMERVAIREQSEG